MVDLSHEASVDGRVPQRRASRPRWRAWLALLAVPLVLVAADTIYWQISERNLENGLAAWLADRREAGWTVAAQSPVPGGWPLAATLTVPDLSLADGSREIPGGISWRSERLILRLDLLRPHEVTIAAEGAQRLRLADGPSIPYNAGKLRLALPLQTGVPQFAELSAEAVRADLPGGAEISLGALRLHLDLRPNAPAGEPAVMFSFQARAVSPPPPFDKVLGPRITSFAVNGALDGPMIQAGTPAASAAAWRDAGGSLAIQHLALSWGPLDLTGSATLALDEQLQPMGAGSARAVGYADTLDALAAHGIITRSAATAAKAVLSLLARSPDDGSPADVEVPLTLQYRTLSMRQVPLMRLPEVDWR